MVQFFFVTRIPLPTTSPFSPFRPLIGVAYAGARGALLTGANSEAINGMRDGGYWIGDSIVAAALKQAGEA